MSIELSNEIEYSTKSELHPSYTYDEITQQTGGTDVTLTAAGGNNSLFEIPAVAFNLSKSYLRFDYTLPAVAAVGGNNQYSNQYKSVLPHIRQIQFYGRNGQMMCDLQNFDIYTRIIFNSDLSHEELTNGTVDTPVFRNNQSPIDADAGRQSLTQRPGVGRANLNYIEQAYLLNAGTGAGGVATTARYRIPFSLFKNTILSLNKDLYFGDITYIRIYWNDRGALGYSSRGTATDQDAAAVAANITLSNLNIYLAVENNERINDVLAQTIASPGGLNILLDYVHQENFNGAGASQSFYTKYGPGMGQRLKRLYWCVLDNPTAVNTRYTLSNIDGNNAITRISRFYTELDSHRFIKFDIDCTDAGGNKDYMIIADRLKGGAIQNKNIYQANWFWCESFDGLKLHDHDDNLIAGLEIDKIEHKYQTYITLVGAANYTYYVYAVIQKNLNISSLGISIS